MTPYKFKMTKFISVFFLTFSFCSKPLFGQNSYKFIEPNISISYDSNYFRVEKRYSNTFYETESYDFSYHSDSEKKVNIHIKASHPLGAVPKAINDSSILAGIEEIKKAQNDTFSLVDLDQKVRIVSDFSCFGVVGFDKVNNIYTTFITCYHYSDSDNTEINYISNGKALTDEYAILNAFLKNFKSYSEQEIKSEERLIKSKYTVVVAPTQTIIDDFKYRPKTYLGIVSTKEPLQHKISEVRLTGSVGQAIFSSDENGKVFIILNDKEKGKVSKTGELIILNSFGKKVKLPFTFSYINKGIW